MSGMKASLLHSETHTAVSFAVTQNPELKTQNRRTRPAHPARARRHPGHMNEGWIGKELRAERLCGESRAESLEARARKQALLELRGLPVRAIRGRVGDVVFKTYSRKIIVTRVPSFAGYVPSGAQRRGRERMRKATAYAKRVYADAETKAFYIAVAKKLGRQAFRLAVADYLATNARVRVVEGMLNSRGTASAEQSVVVAQRPATRRPVVRRVWWEARSLRVACRRLRRARRRRHAPVFKTPRARRVLLSRGGGSWRRQSNSLR